MVACVNRITQLPIVTHVTVQRVSLDSTAKEISMNVPQDHVEMVEHVLRISQLLVTSATVWENLLENYVRSEMTAV